MKFLKEFRNEVEMITREQAIQYLSDLPPAELKDVIAEVAETLYVSPRYYAEVPKMESVGPEEEEQVEFDVKLVSFGDKKMGVVKEVRALLGHGLKESKELVESAPCIIATAVPRERADELAAKLKEAGAVIEVQ